MLLDGPVGRTGEGGTQPELRRDRSQGAPEPEGRWRVPDLRIDLVTTADVPGISDDEFQQAAQGAKEGCPVSTALAAVEITLNATLAG